ncbi:hypothetical protein [Streptomyces sp. HNA39]|uniref:hypothetical protein n=1 Tax=Streptomyces sp. HNA39 TaxID=2850561 RepID=UPI00200D9CC7|nr:hypothetical protein [Streptomyces sp. HNA39]UQA33222.1 hypothetical protein KRR37_05310 [Streptomyces sp. HNA39]
MIELTDPRLTTYDIVLNADDPTRGPGQGSADAREPAALAGRLRLGGPHALRLTPEELAADPELARYAEEQAALYEHHLVRLALTFVPQTSGLRIKFANVSLQLTSGWGPKPIAHSMDPIRLTDPVQIERVRRLGPQLSLLGADASLGEISRTVGYTTNQPLVQALDLGGSSPAWDFRPTTATELSGTYPLSLVVRCGAGADTELKCTVTAGVEKPLLRRFSRELPDPLQLKAFL